jgi:hypothetical protein
MLVSSTLVPFSSTVLLAPLAVFSQHQLVMASREHRGSKAWWRQGSKFFAYRSLRCTQRPKRETSRYINFVQCYHDHTTSLVSCTARSYAALAFAGLLLMMMRANLHRFYFRPRPDFHMAMPGGESKEMYESLLEQLRVGMGGEAAVSEYQYAYIFGVHYSFSISATTPSHGRFTSARPAAVHCVSGQLCLRLRLIWARRH